MTSIDPYKPTGANLEHHSRDRLKPSVIYLVLSLILLLLAGLSIYGAVIVSGDDTEYENTLERLDELARRIETQEITLERETLLEYFKNNKQALVEEHQLQSNSLVINFLVGVVIFLIAVVQLIIYWNEFRRR